MTKKILFVAMQQSPHTARWIKLLADQGWDLHLFPTNNRPSLPFLHNVTIHRPWYKIPRLASWLELLAHAMHRSAAPPSQAAVPDGTNRVRYLFPIALPGAMDRVLCSSLQVKLGESATQVAYFYGPQMLARLIRKLKPDLVHSIEFQHNGYRMLEARRLLGTDCPPWLATNWGSDIYYYQRFADHRRQIIRLLHEVDYYACECQRDIDLARGLGLQGRTMPVMPNTGGFDLDVIAELRQRTLPSARKLVLLKGYQSFAGRALIALDAMERCHEQLNGYTIAVYSASPTTLVRMQQLQQRYGLCFRHVEQTNHSEMLELFADARLYIGINISDGISTSMLEAMALGAFPVQTTTACCDEWFEDGVGGFGVPIDDVELIAQRIRHALSDDALVNRASSINWHVVEQRLDNKRLRGVVADYYHAILNGTHTDSVRVHME